MQLLHGDYRSTNLLWSDDAVSGVIDVDDMRVDHRVDEIARSAVLLGTGFRDWNPVTPAQRAEFLMGCLAVAELSRPERAWLDAAVLWCSIVVIPRGERGSAWVSAALAEAHRRL